MTIDVVHAKNLAPVPHGFFTRTGGVSKGEFAELNCGLKNGDEVAKVQSNRAVAVQALGRAAGSLVIGNQTHSSTVVVVAEPSDMPATCDGVVTAAPELSLGVLTADCQPVLLADHEAGVVGAAHAGWRGALNGIIGNTIAKMIDLGAKRQRICAAIGPSICQESYEVGPEFRAAFLKRASESGRHFTEGVGDRFHFDLQGFSLELLRREGIESAEWTGECTYKNPRRYFSYRRSAHERKSTFGVMISVIAI